MSNLPADWALKAAFKAAGLPEDLENVKRDRARSGFGRSLIAHARLIEQTQPAPVDRKLLCAREVMAQIYEAQGREDGLAKSVRGGGEDNLTFAVSLGVIVEAITLWEDGFGNNPETVVPQCP